MPQTQDPLEIPIPSQGNQTMSNPAFDALVNQSMAQLSGSAVVAQNNFITVNKIIDYDFLENKRIVTLDEAIGVREVSSQTVPAGPSVRPAGT